MTLILTRSLPAPASRAAVTAAAAALLLVAGFPSRNSAARQQDPAPPPSVAAAARATTKTVTAVLLAVDAERKSVRLKSVDGGAPGDVWLTTLDPECDYTKKGAAATLAAFAPGERVVARLAFRTSPQQVVILRGLWDEPSYLSERQARTELCIGKVASATPSAIAVRRERDGALVTFRVTEKTRILKFDKPAPLEAFPPGERIAVKPRGLPGGGVMAAIVGGTAAEVTAAHLDTLIRWEGIIHAVDAAPGGAAGDGPVVTLLRSDGATRRVLLVPGASLKQGRKALTAATLPVGVAARVHLVRGREKNRMRFADEIAVVTRRETTAVDN